MMKKKLKDSAEIVSKKSPLWDISHVIASRTSKYPPFFFSYLGDNCLIVPPLELSRKME